jgi:hypothetical protein
VALKSQSSRVYRSFGKSGFGSRGDKFLDIAIAEIAIGKIPKRKKERSALTVSGFGDSRDQRLTTGFAKLRSPISQV